MPRGRYSTVCINAEGFDNGGLCRELSAYAGSIVQQKVRVLDRQQSSNTTPDHWLEVWFDDQDGEIIARLASDKVGSGFNFSAANPATFGMSLAYTTRPVEVGNTIDLRLPSTQEWFVQTFRGVFRRPGAEPGGASGVRFLDVLPELVSRDLGGSRITDAIGHYLRRLGAAALIYPSARCDARVVIKDGALADWYGFNLVDFRETEEIASGTGTTPETLFKDFDPWRTHFDWPGARCLAVDPADDSPLQLNGSWHLEGVERSHYQFFHAGGTLGGREGGEWRDVEVDNHGRMIQQLLLALKANRTPGGNDLFDSQAFRVDLDRPDGELLQQAIQLHAISASLSSRGHAEKARDAWTQAADALRKVTEAKDAELAQAARLKLGSMLHQVVVERMAAGDTAGALQIGDEALRVLKPAAGAPVSSPISAQVSVMIRAEEGRCLNNLGTLRANEGQSEAARQLFDQAVAVDRTLIGEVDEAPLELARALQNYSAASLTLGEQQQALDAAQEATALCREAAGDDAGGLRASRGSLHSLQAALIARSELDQAKDVSIELLGHAFHAMQTRPELVDEFKLDPLRAATPYATAGRHGLAREIVDKALEGYQAMLPSDPVRFTDLLAKGHLLKASVAAAEHRHADVADSAFAAASAWYAYKDLSYGGSTDKFVESEYHEAFTQSVNLFHSAMIQAGRESEVPARLADLDMRPAPTDGVAADAYRLMEAATTACNAFFDAPSETTQAAAQTAIGHAESFFLAHPGHADLVDLAREWDRIMAQIRGT